MQAAPTQNNSGGGQALSLSVFRRRVADFLVRLAQRIDGGRWIRFQMGVDYAAPGSDYTAVQIVVPDGARLEQSDEPFVRLGQGDFEKQIRGVDLLQS